MKRLPDIKNDSFLNALNDLFYEQTLKLFEDSDDELTLTFAYKSLKIMHVQLEDHAETNFIINNKNVFILKWQATSQSGEFIDKKLAMGNTDFKEIMDNYIKWCPFDIDYDDFYEDDK